MSAIKTRYLILVWLLGSFVIPVESIMSALSIPFSAGWWDATFYYSFYFLLALLVAAAFIGHPPNWANLIGAAPNPVATRDAFAFFVFLWVVSIAIGYLTFFPLSFVYPEFVSHWFLPYAPTIYVEDSSIQWIPSLVNLVPLVVFAPVMEELIFRGILLRRLAYKFGIFAAVAWSSIIFGLAHPDTFAATLFGAAMCVLYLRHGSLLLIIGLHAVWNTVYFLDQLVSTVVSGEEQHYSLEEFQSDWPWGLMFLVISAIWVAILIKSPKRNYDWVLKSA